MSERAFYESIFQNISDGVMCIDKSGTVVLINESAEMLLRDTNHSLKGTPISEFAEVHEYEFEKKSEEYIQKLLESESMQLARITDIVISPKNIERDMHGIAVPAKDNGEVTGIALIFSDTWHRTDHIEQYKQHMNDQVLGKFAHDVGHHFNNILMAIWSNLNIVKMDIRSGNQNQEEMNEFLRDIDKQIEQASSLSKSLLQFSETGKLVETYRSLHDLLTKYITFYIRDHNIKTEYDLDDELWSLDMDKVQLAHVLHNVLENSVDAIIENGIIKIRAHNVEVNANQSKRMKPGKYVRIVIEDNGIGIPADVIPFVFEPFFTIKADQGAQGLGLTIARSVMTQNNGYIDLTSEQGEGTKVCIYVPARVGPKATEAFTHEI